MTIDIKDGSSDSGSVPVRRRNPQGSKTVTIAASIPQELNQTINGIVVKSGKSRSLVIAELIGKGLGK